MSNDRCWRFFLVPIEGSYRRKPPLATLLVAKTPDQSNGLQLTFAQSQNFYDNALQPGGKAICLRPLRFAIYQKIITGAFPKEIYLRCVDRHVNRVVGLYPRRSVNLCGEGR